MHLDDGSTLDDESCTPMDYSKASSNNQHSQREQINTSTGSKYYSNSAQISLFLIFIDHLHLSEQPTALDMLNSMAITVNGTRNLTKSNENRGEFKKRLFSFMFPIHRTPISFRSKQINGSKFSAC